LDIFSFGWLEGNRQTALQQPNSIVLTDRVAEKFFPDQSALGKSVELPGLGIFTITGIMPEAPIRSHIYFDYLMSFSTVLSFTKEQQEKHGFYGFDGISRGLVYLLIDEKTSRNQLEEALVETAAAYSLRSEKEHYLFQSQALAAVMPSQDLSNEIGTATPAVVMYFLMALGLIIMLSACFNYMNLSVARSLKRAKEIGVRKVIGARKKDIILQFLGEAVLISVLALVVAIGLLEFLIPAFYGLDQFVEEVFYLKRTPQLYLLFFGFSLLIGLIAGIFPAFNISAFSPLQAINKLSNVKILSRVGIRKALITAQFTLSLIFILVVIIVLQQQKHVLQADIGSNTDNMLNVRMQDTDYEIFAQQVRQLKGVEEVSASSLVILTGENASTTVTFEEATDSMNLHYSTISPNYLENLGIELIAGSNFSENTNSQGEQFIILNEKAVQRMGYETPKAALGEFVTINDSTSLAVLGVVRDFHHDNIWFQPIQPYGFRSGGDFARNANIQLSGTDVTTTLGEIKAIWKELSPQQSMISFFVNERIYYLANFFRMGSKIIGFIGFLTILIACLGLLGMVIYTVEGRIKEVGIRKVLGASEKNVIWQLSKGFILLLSIAIVIAVPLTVLGANLWLQNFVLRVSISPSMILAGIGILMILGALTVVSQTYLAAKANPIQSLRNE